MQIQFKRLENTRHRGYDSVWIYDQIDAFIDEEKVGYLRMAYISSEQMKKFKKEPFLFATQALRADFDFFEKTYKFEKDKSSFTYTPILLNQALFVLSNIEFKGSTQSQEFNDRFDEINKMEERELQEYINENNTKTFNYFCKKGKRYLEYHSCRPDIDFIQVEEEHQLKGIGTALYREAARWMLEKGMVLHSSTLQSGPAQKAWDKMVERGEADFHTIKGHTHPRFRYTKGADPKMLTDKIIISVKLPSLTIKEEAQKTTPFKPEMVASKKQKMTM